MIMSSFVSDFTEYCRAAMTEFLNPQAQVEGDNYTSGEDFEEDGEVSSFIQDSFENDYDPALYYRLNNVTRNAEEALEDPLNNHQPQTEEVSNYFRESSEK